MSLIEQIAGVLLVAMALGVVAMLLRQPMVVAFIAAGVAVGPAGLGLVAQGEPYDSLAELGVALLLFLVGLRLDLNVVRRMGPSAAIAGLLQVAITTTLAFGVLVIGGLGPVPSLLVGVGLALSSTVIVVKLLADKREIDSLHGRLSVGILIVQDLVVIVALIVVAAIGRGAQAASGPGVLDFVLRGAALLVVLGMLGRFVLPRLLHALARSTEAIVLFGIAWAVVVGVAAEHLGFSLELGAFLAGIGMASTRYRDAIGGRLTSVRDFLLLFFFVVLGATLDLDSLAADWLTVVLLSLFVLIVKPLIVFGVLVSLGYARRTAFLAAVALAQISEFSLILLVVAAESGQVEREVAAMMTAVGLLSIVASSALIARAQFLYNALRPILDKLPLRRPTDVSARETVSTCDVLIFGLGRFGSNLANELTARGLRVVGADFDPEAVAAARRHGITARYADVEDPEQLRELPLADVRCVISAVPQMDVNLALWSGLRELGYPGEVALTAHSQADAKSFERLGATHVLLPFHDAAIEAADRVALTLLPHRSARPDRS